MPQLLFGGLIAIILLFFYVWAILDAVSLTKCVEELCKDETIKNCIPKECKELSPEMATLLNLIGGLISATVVGVLGATKTGEFPGRKSFENNLTGKLQKFATYMPSIYIFIWILCGVYIVIIAYSPNTNNSIPELNSHARVWLGTAIAATYAYFGITPDGNPIDRPAIAKIIIEPTNIDININEPTQKLKVTAKDDTGNVILNLTNKRFDWTSNNPNIATVDKEGLVTWIAQGNCKITASADENKVVSNECEVKCN